MSIRCPPPHGSMKIESVYLTDTIQTRYLTHPFPEKGTYISYAEELYDYFTKRMHFGRLVVFSHQVMPDFAIPWTATRQASLSFTIFWSLLKFMSIESMMPSHDLILCPFSHPQYLYNFKTLKIYPLIFQSESAADQLLDPRPGSLHSPRPPTQADPLGKCLSLGQCCPWQRAGGHFSSNEPSSTGWDILATADKLACLALSVAGLGEGPGSRHLAAPSSPSWAGLVPWDWDSPCQRVLQSLSAGPQLKRAGLRGGVSTGMRGC